MPVLNTIPARMRDLDGSPVRRLLPSPVRRKVGPWVFLDHFGPATMDPGKGIDVRPHPHCALSTVTFLFEGEMEHRDSTGAHAIVRPGEIHWMRAGHGIAHSERTPRQARVGGHRAHGLQLWCAHPDGAEEQEPGFGSWTELPQLELEGVRVRLLAGEGWGHRSPVEVTSPLVYALAELRAGQTLALPDHEERCVYAVSGGYAIDGAAGEPEQLLVVDRAARRIEARTDAVLAILGGDAIGPRHLWWNLVHSDPDRLREQAERWREGGFPTVVGDEVEFIPAPEGPWPSPQPL